MSSALWAVLLLLPVTSLSGAKITTLLAKHGGELPIGTVLKSSSPFAKVFLVIDNIHLAFMPRVPCYLATHSGLKVDRMDNTNKRNYRIIAHATQYNSQRAVVLAKRLLGLSLPYRFFTCNEYLWMDYIVFGTRSSMKKCPLARPLDNVSIAEIQSPEFEFWYPKSGRKGQETFALSTTHRSYLFVTGYRPFLVREDLRVPETVGLPVPQQIEQRLS